MDTAIAYEKVRRIIDEMNLDAILITDRYNMSIVPRRGRYSSGWIR